MTQLSLPLEGRTRCGYCGRELTRQGDVDGRPNYGCAFCGPLLAEIRTVEDWKSFSREAARR